MVGGFLTILSYAFCLLCLTGACLIVTVWLWHLVAPASLTWLGQTQHEWVNGLSVVVVILFVVRVIVAQIKEWAK